MLTQDPIPIWLVETEVGGGLPSARRYSTSAGGPPIGRVVLPPTHRVERYSDHVVLWEFPEGRQHPTHVASLSSDARLVEAAVAGEFGLRWESAELVP